MSVIAQFHDQGHSGYLAGNSTYQSVFCTTCPNPDNVRIPILVARWRVRRNTPTNKAGLAWQKHMKKVAPNV